MWNLDTIQRMNNEHKAEWLASKVRALIRQHPNGFLVGMNGQIVEDGSIAWVQGAYESVESVTKDASNLSIQERLIVISYTPSSLRLGIRTNNVAVLEGRD